MGSLRQSQPLIVGTLIGTHSLHAQLRAALKYPFPILEIRLDTFPELYLDRAEAMAFSLDLVRCVKATVKKKILLTFRSSLEGGTTFGPRPFSEMERILFFKKLIPYVDLVDIEVQHRQLLKTITATAHRFKKRVIHSYHDFKTQGNKTKITRTSLLSLKHKGDFLKLAVMITKESQLKSFFKFTSGLKNKKILIGMGRAGARSRLMAFTFGSVMTYGHLGCSAAPGQLFVGDLMKKIKQIYPFA